MSVPPERFSEVEALAKSHFKVRESLLLHGVPTFILEPGPTKEPFEKLAHEARAHQLTPFLRKQAGELVLSFFPEPQRPRPRVRWNVILFMATLGTITISGCILGSNYRGWISERLALPAPDLASLTILFAASLLLIIGLHECGHKVASRWSGIESSAPYFIPGPPPIGTFGAIIVQRSFPVNRDQLFDMGLSGLLLGFLTTIAVALIGIQLCIAVPFEAIPLSELKAVSFPQIPALFQLLLFTRALDHTAIILDHPMLVAAYVGCIVTFLNALPIWQLDGGHVARAALGKRWHRIVGFLAWAALLLSGYYMLVAILLLFALFAGGAHPGPLDDVSPLSAKRKMLSVSLLVTALLSFTIPAVG